MLEAIETSGMEPEPQDESIATYVEKINPADREIGWNRSAPRLPRRCGGYRHISVLIPALVKGTGSRSGSRLWRKCRLKQTSRRALMFWINSQLPRFRISRRTQRFRIDQQSWQ